MSFTRKQPTDTLNSNCLCIIYSDQHFLYIPEQNKILFTYDQIASSIDITNTPNISIGYWNKQAVFALLLTEKVNIPLTQWERLRPIMLQTDGALFRLLSFASQLITWTFNSQYCGHCGHKMLVSTLEYKRVCSSSCQQSIYPPLSPSMIVLVTQGDKVLLARSPRFSKGVYSTLSGFIEPAESVEEAVHREVYEEVGIKLHDNVRYITSQNWPYPNSLMLGFHAVYKSGDIVMQPEEIEDAQWFSINDLPPLPPKQAVSRYLIDLYVAEQLSTTKPALPY